METSTGLSASATTSHAPGTRESCAQVGAFPLSRPLLRGDEETAPEWGWLPGWRMPGVRGAVPAPPAEISSVSVRICTPFLFLMEIKETEV